MKSSLLRMARFWPWLASALLLIAMFMPPVNRLAPVHRYLLVFDISQSMNVTDVTYNSVATTRLSLSMIAARKLLDTLPCGSHIGLSVFAATRTVTLLTSLEVCEHYNGLLASLDSIDGRMRYRNASSIGKGLHQSIRAANIIGDDTAVIMFTDGHEAPPLRDGQKGMPKSEGHDIKGFIIGVGGDTPVRIPKVDNNGRNLGFWQANEVAQRPQQDASSGRGQSHEELSSLHQEHLIHLGELSGLHYQRLQSVETLVKSISNASFAPLQRVPVDVRWIPASLALLVLLIRFFPFSFVRRN